MISLDYSLGVTILYVILLYILMNHFFFKPVVRILHERKQLIEGRIESAQKRIADVDKRTAEYEQTLKQARADAYRSQEKHREQALADKAQLVSRAKLEGEQLVRDARTRLVAEADSAKQKLDSEVNNLARELSSALLRDRS